MQSKLPIQVCHALPYRDVRRILKKSSASLTVVSVTKGKGRALRIELFTLYAEPGNMPDKLEMHLTWLALHALKPDERKSDCDRLDIEQDVEDKIGKCC